MMTRSTLAAAAVLMLATPVLAAGNLGTKPTELPDLILGTDDTGYGVSQKDFELETGKAYSLKIESTGNKECAWVAEGFFASVWLRKVEAGGIEIKGPYLTEIEYEGAGEAEIFVVPIVPGEYEWECEGLADKGMTGKFIVK